MRIPLLPILSLAGLSLALRVAFAGAASPAPAQPIATPAAAPFPSSISGSGIVEASTENIAIGTHISGIVAEVFVSPGQEIEPGSPIFRIDDRDAVAELGVRKASLELAEAELEAAETARDEAATQFRRIEEMRDVKVLSVEERDRRRFTAQAADAKLAAAGALIKTRRAELQLAQTTLERHTVRSPIRGTVLQSKVRAGEYAVAGPVSEPLVLLGATKPLHVRVDIDENDAWRMRSGAAGVASVRGNRTLETRIEFVRIEPYIVPKRSLTGAANERTDTRVLQVVYRIADERLPVFAGQLMDVFIEGTPAPDGTVR